MKDNYFADYDKTEPIGGHKAFPNAGNKTDPTEPFGDPVFPAASGNIGGMEKTDFAEQPTPGFTPTLQMGKNAEGETEGFDFQESGFTEVIGMNDSFGYMPAVGWLVCIEGNNRGRDYRLHAGYNTIGKNPENDIAISGDDTVSRERHAVIAYDQEENLFFFAPQNGVNLLRLNGKVLMMPSEIKANDILTIGKSRFIFIPLCSENFRWEEKES